MAITKIVQIVTTTKITHKQTHKYVYRLTYPHRYSHPHTQMHARVDHYKTKKFKSIIQDISLSRLNYELSPLSLIIY